MLLHIQTPSFALAVAQLQVTCALQFRWDTAVHQTLTLFTEVGLACEPIVQPEQLLLWLCTQAWAKLHPQTVC